MCNRFDLWPVATSFLAVLGICPMSGNSQPGLAKWSATTTEVRLQPFVVRLGCRSFFRSSNWTLKHYTGRISRRQQSIKKTESHRVQTSHRSCNGLSCTLISLSSTFTHHQFFEFPLEIISWNASRRCPDAWITRTIECPSAIRSCLMASSYVWCEGVSPYKHGSSKSSESSTSSSFVNLLMIFPEQMLMTCRRHMILQSLASKGMSRAVKSSSSSTMKVALFSALSKVKWPTCNGIRYTRQWSQDWRYNVRPTLRVTPTLSKRCITVLASDLPVCLLCKWWKAIRAHFKCNVLVSFQCAIMAR